MVMANMSWMPYQYVNSSWQTADLSQSLDNLILQLDHDPYSRRRSDATAST
jgi:hypothetical protein